MDFKHLKELILNYENGVSMKVKDPETGSEKTFSPDEIRKIYESKLVEYTKDPKTFRRHKIDIYEIFEEMFAEILPRQMEKAFDNSVRVHNVGFGDKPIFKVKRGRIRGKSFVTKVGPSGRFDAFRLDQDRVEVSTEMMGGAGYIDLFDMFKGYSTLSELAEILLEGFQDKIYLQLHEALTTATSKMPQGNSVISAGFDAAKMKKLVSVAKRYSSDNSATIYCFPEFADTIITDASFHPYMTDGDKEDIRNRGAIGKWFGANIVLLQNSFTDETNTVTVFDESKALIIPGGLTEPLAHIVFEGEPIMKEYERDGNFSAEYQMMQATGLAVLHQNMYCIYENTDI